MKTPNMLEAKKRTNNKVNILYDEYKITNDMKIGKNKTYHIKTYGCQMNEHDTEMMCAMLEEMGYTKCDEMEEADVILLNTCAIRENAHNKVFGMLGRIKHLREKRPNIIVGLCGCMAQEEVVIDEIKNKLKWLDLVFGTHNIHRLPVLLNEVSRKKEQEIEVYSKEGDIIENLPYIRDNKFKSWVNIMYGCDKFCTYCIVPYTRGKQRSRKHEDIVREVENLIKDGVVEITLLGQNVNAYGKDLYENYGMENLLEDVAKTGIQRIKFVTSHPWDFTDKMIEIINKYDNVLPFIHLPVQSGSDRILKLMGRRYTKESYLTLFSKMREQIRNVSITTDIIVGFPGETEEDFNETLKLYEQCKFDLAYTFIYSPRVGTPAAKMKDDVSEDEKKERLARLNEKVNKYALESNKKLLNKTVSVLIEGISEKDENILTGYTDTNKLINVVGNKENIGKIVNVKVCDAKTWSLDGIIE
ncbi:MAG: tRNA (N6-isopentenyl adenosine(37)-C2)-methylthiotransferase MiaB [Bacilli bacterium]|nr:tRNA (N6-isopentenyl adenosine(37)-C2)-methylthiotransferase MiaB [Bacilli bacterium]